LILINRTPHTDTKNPTQMPPKEAESRLPISNR